MIAGAGTAAIQLRNVTVSYDRKPAIRSVSVDIAAAQRVAIVGPNGAGKSTLIKAVVGLVELDAGRISVHGQDIAQVRQRVA
jgi:ABC-type Mn2+/Zn2+ transport system ATPase subunit